MKKRSLIILLVAVLVGLVVIGAGTTYAWLTQEDEKVITYEVGEINYGITLEEEEDANLVVPGQDITPEITITNSSNIDTQLRVKFTIAKTSGDREVWTIGTEDTNHLKLTLNTNWVYEEEDGYYYYKGSSNEVADNKIAANTNPESIFTSLVINGNKVGNTQSGAQIEMTIKFEVKQADYIKWSDMGNISFITGLPNA